MLKKVISGGQTGADFAGLLAARAAGLETGGHCPKGWRTEKGPNPKLTKFGLVETPSRGYEKRTEWNVMNADATIIISQDWKSPGTIMTQEFVDKHRKLSFEANFFVRGEPVDVLAKRLADWLFEQQIEVLNVAGNRESKAPGIQVWLIEVLIKAFKQLEERYNNV